MLVISTNDVNLHLNFIDSECQQNRRQRPLVVIMFPPVLHELAKVRMPQLRLIQRQELQLYLSYDILHLSTYTTSIQLASANSC